MFKRKKQQGIVLQSNIIASVLMLVVYFVMSGFGLNGGGALSEDVSLGPRPAVTNSLDGLRGNVAGKVIVVDPGHGGNNPGAVGVGPMPEKDVVLKIAYDLKSMLEYAGATVIMTRVDDTEPASGYVEQLAARSRMANGTGADLFVSVHANWNKSSRIQGAETYYYSNTGKQLASDIQSELVRQSGAQSLGHKYGNFHVLRTTKMPAALVEVGFLSNKQEALKLAQPEYQERLARGIYFGVEKFFSQRR